MWELEILSVAPGVSASWISDDSAPPGIRALRHSQGNVPAGGRVSGGELGFTAVGHAATMSATPQERCAEHVRINADMRGRADKMSPC
ncbi:Uncharacterised protein [Mycobacteroides abscessus subsp. abscessus]|nr:Uncharacterised protein [Mycobacteroides abscessus subsp. abscessus]